MTFIRKISFSCPPGYLQTGLGPGLVILLALPAMRSLLESNLISHMLIQIPMLVLCGWMLGKTLLRYSALQWNADGIPGLIIALFAMLFWMIPRWLDAALSESIWELLKFITIPLLIGVPLACSWSRISSFARAVVWCNSISMLVVLGWLYVAAPVRVCNNYLVNQQQEFGYTAMALASGIAAYWIILVFFGDWQQPEKHCG